VAIIGDGRGAEFSLLEYGNDQRKTN